MKNDQTYISDIKREMSNIENFVGDITKEEFEKDQKTIYAVIRSLEIIGEATKNLSEEFKQKYKNIPWKKIAGMRDHLIHGYLSVKLDIVWNTVKNNIPKLKQQLIKPCENRNPF